MWKRPLKFGTFFGVLALKVGLLLGGFFVFWENKNTKIIPMSTKLDSLQPQERAALVENRWNESSTLWSKVESTFKKNKGIWANQPEWLAYVPNKRSKVRDNRTFLAVESVINNLTGRPSKPNVIPANETNEAGLLAEDMQDFLLAKYTDLSIKEKMRRALRFLFFSKVIVLKIFWNPVLDDFDIRVVDSRNVRLPKSANSMFEAEFAIERIPEKPVMELIEMFPEKEKEILKKVGYSKERLLVENLTVEYREAWIEDCVIYELQGMEMGYEPHPYWDWDGLQVTKNEQTKLKYMDEDSRKVELKRLRQKNDYRKGSATKYEQYLFNHFDRPLVPYIFGTILNIEDSPIGETSLIEQVNPLQEEVDKRKRQISDNAETMNGVYKVDTRFTTISKADAQAAKSDPRGIWYGDGVREGVTIETGKELPSFILNELEHSIREIDNIFGTNTTFRGEGGSQETATGRAILREQNFQRLDELVGLVDFIHYQIYNWMFQMVKVKYTESHYVKPIGAEGAKRVISITQDDLTDGIEIKIIPGQIMPEDRLFKAERAKEEAIAGLITPLQYFKETERDNPMQLAKELEMYKINPFAILDMSQEDLAKIQQALQLFQGVQQAMQPPQQEGAPVKGVSQAEKQDPKAQEMGQLRQQAEDLMASQEFQQMPPDQQQEVMAQIREQLQNVMSSAGI